MPAAHLSPVFAGRRPELAELGAALRRAQSGDPGVVLVTGEAGIGKSRLVEEATAAARAAGALVLTGACVDLGEDALPHAPLVAALREVVRAEGAPAVAARVPGRADVLGALVPELASAQATAGLPRGQLHEVLLDLLDSLGAQGGGLVLVLEDLHWADGATRGALDVLARRLRGRVLVVGTVRTDALHRGHVLRPLLAELERLRTVTRLELDRLDADAVAVQLAGILGHDADPATAACVLERSEGNPFFVEELVCSGSLQSGALADSLRDLLLTRVERLEPDVQHVLRRMSAGGASLHHRLVAAVCDLPEDRLATALSEAVSHRVLVPDHQEDRLGFRHSLLREALHEDLLPGEHSQIHVRYARALEADPSLLPTGGVAAETAHHWYSAHDLPRALPATLAAADEARRVVAYAEEQRLLERALGLWESLPDAAELTGTDHAALLLRTARAAGDAGEPERELALIDTALALLDRGREPVRVALALEQRSKTLRLLARPGNVETLREALALLPAGADAERASVLASLSKALMLVPAPDEAIAVAQEGLAVARAIGDVPAELHLLDSLGCSLILLGEVDRGSRIVREAADMARSLVGADDVRTCANLSDVLEHTGHHEEAAAEALRGVERAAAVGDARTHGTLLAGNAAESLLALGRWDEAAGHLEAALAENPRGVNSSFLHRLLADLLLDRGHLDAAARHLAQAHGDLGRHYSNAQFHLPVARTMAELALAQGDAERAVVVAEHALRRGMAPYEPPAQIPLDGPAAEEAELVRRRAASARYAWPVLEVGARAVAELALLARDRRDDAAAARAAAAAHRLLALEETMPAGLAPYRAWRVSSLAELDRAAAAVAGSGDEHRPRWAEAVQAWEDSPSALPLARARVRAAELLAAAGDRAGAGELLRRAAAVADALGAAPLRTEIADLARRARIDLLAVVPVAREGVDGPAQPDAEPAADLGLTPREVEVLALVSEGLTNGQIAERLFITTKTASVHVSNILAKLGVGTRVEAAATAHRLRLFEAEERSGTR